MTRGTPRNAKNVIENGRRDRTRGEKRCCLTNMKDAEREKKRIRAKAEDDTNEKKLTQKQKNLDLDVSI